MAPSPAPPTPVPVTAAPPSPAPPTAAPPTPMPRTSAPRTAAPQTLTPTALPSPAPETPAPSTAHPATAVPGTPNPPTSAPPTPAATRVWEASPTEPPTPTPQRVKLGLSEEDKDMLRNTAIPAATASVISGVGSGMAPGAAGKLALIRNFGCEVDDVDLGFDEPLDFEFHPTGVALGRGRARYLVGAVVMNLTLLIAFLGLCVGGAVLLATVTDRTFEQSLAVLKSPGLLLVPYMFLLPGTCLASARLLFSPHVIGTPYAVLGGIVLVFVCASPVLLYTCIIRHVSAEAHIVADPRLFLASEIVSDELRSGVLSGWKRMVYAFMFGDYIWVSYGGSYFCDTTGLVFDSYKEGRAWVLLAEIGLNILLSFMSAWKPADSTQCHVRNGIISVAFLAFFGAVAWMKPFLAALDNAVATALAGMTAFALVAITIGIAGELGSDGVVFGISAWCLLLSALLVMAKGLYDLIVYAVDVFLERRQGARDEARVKARESIPEYGLTDIVGVCDVVHPSAEFESSRHSLLHHDMNPADLSALGRFPLQDSSAGHMSLPQLHDTAGSGRQRHGSHPGEKFSRITTSHSSSGLSCSVSRDRGLTGVPPRPARSATVEGMLSPPQQDVAVLETATHGRATIGALRSQRRSSSNRGAVQPGSPSLPASPQQAPIAMGRAYLSPQRSRTALMPLRELSARVLM
eukprot:TRINITY_DN1699_c0_g1_i2.p1 TRINITY_DN1699_c0_g1~~TRINITY_DN1699_c0_g1_i2.p1  ORF type:complete len:786 (+),score=107.48 TRINITY_DN1699_c0_g1_i2:291-2360(+)